MSISIRPAALSDAGALPLIEASAAKRFDDAPGLEWIANDDPMSSDTHRQFIPMGYCLVAEDDSGAVGFLTAEPFAPELHIWELAVRLDRQGQGAGRALLGEVAALARNQGMSALTLTTFRDVPWNAPFYARFGFAPVEDDALSERLVSVFALERRLGLPVERRCALRLGLRNS
jgi:GNAT superfamily N-acetyltransferase